MPLRLINLLILIHRFILIEFLRYNLLRFVRINKTNTALLIKMTRAELIAKLASDHPQLTSKDIELTVRTILDEMSRVLSKGGRVEVRGFGSFNLNHRPPRNGRNPKTGAPVLVPAKYFPHFKAGKELRERVDPH